MLSTFQTDEMVVKLRQSKYGLMAIHIGQHIMQHSQIIPILKQDAELVGVSVLFPPTGIGLVNVCILPNITTEKLMTHLRFQLAEAKALLDLKNGIAQLKNQWLGLGLHCKNRVCIAHRLWYTLWMCQHTLCLKCAEPTSWCLQHTIYKLF